MAKRKRDTNEQVIQNRIDEGRGQGRGADYNPWLHIQDVSSEGFSVRIKGWKTNRVHHFMSLLERSYFYLAEWSPIVSDIREQYPLLPIEDTLSIAQHLGVKHPADPKTKKSIVMTTDFVLTVADEQGGTHEIARAVKPAQKLASARVVEKLEIERLYWDARQIDWGIVTEREMPQQLVKNLELLHPRKSLDGYLTLSEGEIEVISKLCQKMIQENNQQLHRVATEVDLATGYEAGTCLAIIYYHLANRRWQVDMDQPLIHSKSVGF